MLRDGGGGTLRRACRVWPGVTAGWRQVVYANSMPHCFTLRPSTAAFKCCACNPIRLLRKEQQQQEEERRRKKKKEEELWPANQLLILICSSPLFKVDSNNNRINIKRWSLTLWGQLCKAFLHILVVCQTCTRCWPEICMLAWNLYAGLSVRRCPRI